MTQPTAVTKVKLFCGIIAAGQDCIPPAQERLTAAFGPIDAESELFPFDLTDYYESEMGPALVRKFVAFQDLIAPDALADAKLTTIALEQDLASKQRRSVNLDPGYITAAKLVLASAKNRAHRICLRDGIYAELTMTFHKQVCRTFDWTFTDFKSGRYNSFLLAVRQTLIPTATRTGSSPVD